MFALTSKDLSAASTEELRAVNRQICDELKARARRRDSVAVDAFRVGDIVTFTHKGRRVEAKVTAVNIRTVTAKETGDFGMTWRVHAGSLSKVNA